MANEGMTYGSFMMSPLNVTGNYTSYIKNFSHNVYYGINVSGTKFNLYPESGLNPMMVAPGDGGTIVVGAFAADMMNIRNITNKSYRAPSEGYPLYVEEHNVVLFASEESREKAIEAYGSAEKLIKAYASGLVALINASYTSVTCLNADSDFYVLNNGVIARLPVPDDKYVEDCIKKYGVQKEKLEVNYGFLVQTVIQDKRVDNGLHPGTIVSTDIKYVQKTEIVGGEPIIIENSGLVIFVGKENADCFVNTYGTIGNYMIRHALDATHDIHKEEIEDVNEQIAKDKRGMVETFSLMGATSIASILTENLIRSYNEDSSGEATKKAVKAFAVGLGAIGSVFGLYKLFRYIQKKEKEANAEQ